MGPNPAGLYETRILDTDMYRGKDEQTQRGDGLSQLRRQAWQASFLTAPREPAPDTVSCQPPDLQGNAFLLCEPLCRTL